MNKNQAMAILEAEFLDSYGDWYMDVKELSDSEWNVRHSWGRTEALKNCKDNLKTVVVFQKYFHKARTVKEFKEEFGIEREIIWELARDKWLSKDEYNGRKETRYYFNQQRAKEIWKEDKFVNGAREG